MAINSRGQTVPTRAIKARRWARPDWIEQLGGDFQHQKTSAAERRAIPVVRSGNGKTKNAKPANITQPDLKVQRERIKALTQE